jgi:hypothetical protein
VGLPSGLVPQGSEIGPGLVFPSAHDLERGQRHVGLNHIDVERVREPVRVQPQESASKSLS